MGFLYFGRCSHGRVSGIRKIAPSRSKKPKHLRPDFSIRDHPHRPRKKQRPNNPDAEPEPETVVHTIGKHAFPKPALRRPPTLEGLPTELLHDIFLQALNPALAACSVGLAHVLNGRHLQYRYVGDMQDNLEELSRVVRFRFFTPAFLLAYEERAGSELDLTGVEISPVTSSVAAAHDGYKMLKMLVARGADCGMDEGDVAEAHRENAKEALAAGKKDVVEILTAVSGFVVDSEMLKMAVTGDLGVEFCENLVSSGATVNADVWRHVIRHGDNRYVEMLMHFGAPPAEVLGELGQFI